MIRETFSFEFVAASGEHVAVAWLRRRGWLVALIGALVATLGDLGQLWAVNAGRPALLLIAPPNGVVVVATLAGTLGIPLYAFGYYVRAHRARDRAPRCAAVVASAGTVLAVLGGTVHAVTGAAVLNDVGGIASGLDPLQGVLASGPIVVALWALAAVAFACAAIGELCLPQAPLARVFNPAVLTVVLTAAAPLAPSPWPDFVAPAALNIAHLIFFARLGVLD
ncbi:MAG: hypothetical protein HY899_06880 [Deltaproteobacteria bacterium]|nr:hypothetical protein [Deltaproteobacteria bacterium]